VSNGSSNSERSECSYSEPGSSRRGVSSGSRAPGALRGASGASFWLCGAPVGEASDLVAWTPGKRWKTTLGTKTARISEFQGGLVGLANLGNTCFMNAGLQCLSHIEPICAYFLTGKYAEEINRKNPFSTKGALVQAFAELQEQLWQSSSSTRSSSPKRIHSILAKFAPHLFDGYEQQDAQEFLAYLLDGLHEDLNLIQKRPAQEAQDEDDDHDKHAKLEEDKGEEYVAALTWMRHLMRHKSVFVDLFQGQLRSRLTCTVCGCESKTYDPYLYMSLPLHEQMRTLEDALRLFLADETLTGGDQWRCPRCKCHVDAVKKIDIWKLPPVLVVHLKRFEFNMVTGRFRKIQADLSAPLTVDMTEFVTTQHKDPLIYDIVCVANHTGQFGSGHYTATCQHPIDGRFYHFNDNHVDEIHDTNKVLTNKAYVLFLVRNAPTDLQRQSVSHPELWPHTISRNNSSMLPEIWNLLSPKKEDRWNLLSWQGASSNLAMQRDNAEDMD
jgi:ubiquitin carboxyl-terminal hydrolase 8